MERVMENLLYLTFFLYLFSAFSFVVGVTGKEEARTRRWGMIGLGLAIAGAALHVGFIVLRILVGGHFPTSNMFEFIAFLCFTVVVAFIVIFFLYRSYIIGVFAMSLAVVLLAYASVFPRDVQPLIPALQSHWLYIHVTMAALGQGAFAIGFVAGLVYLIKYINENKGGRSVPGVVLGAVFTAVPGVVLGAVLGAIPGFVVPGAVFGAVLGIVLGAVLGSKLGAQRFALESMLVVVVMFLGFSLVSAVFDATGYQAKFSHVYKGEQVEQEYTLPPIVGPYEGKAIKVQPFLGLDLPLFEAPSWMQGEKAASKFNSVIWSVLTGLILYGVYRLIVRKTLVEALYPIVKRLNLELLDEICYRAIAIGYPIFTLGGLIFAMIWANEAWGRPWGWDPKETWAFITWMFYSAYLHLRLSRGWYGAKSSWLAVGGFIIIMINLIVINLVISGLHSYA